jgi:regulatory protein
LAMREHSRAELIAKLSAHADSPAALAQALDELAAKGLQSDERTASAVARVGAGRYGNARIKAKLQQKGVHTAHIQSALEALDETEFSRAKAVWSRKFGEPSDDPKEKARQMRFLVGRGFSQSVVYRVIRGAEDD